MFVQYCLVQHVLRRVRYPWGWDGSSSRIDPQPLFRDGWGRARSSDLLFGPLFPSSCFPILDVLIILLMSRIAPGPCWPWSMGGEGVSLLFLLISYVISKLLRQWCAGKRLTTSSQKMHLSIKFIINFTDRKYMEHIIYKY